MNRMLGMEVEHQNGIFTFFQDTLQAIVLEAKQMGQFDQGIVGETCVKVSHPMKMLIFANCAALNVHIPYFCKQGG